jgi:hypothetical protein
MPPFTKATVEMSPIDTAATAHVAGQLETLAVALSGRGFATTMVTGRQYLCINVVNRAETRLREDIYAAPGKDGSWWFWWSWADRITPITDIDAAAAKIAHVLAPDGR